MEFATDSQAGVVAVNAGGINRFSSVATALWLRLVLTWALETEDADS